MKISVIVPAYNVPHNLLAPCLESLAMQTLRKDEYEIIIVDDCSTNHETIEGIEAFAAQAPNARIVRHATNLGLNEARWSGVKNATGDYVIFIDGDDPIVRDGLENLRMEATPVDADMVTAPMLRWHPLTKTYSRIPTTDGALPDDYVERLKVILAGESTFSMCGRLFRRELLGKDVFTLPVGMIHEDVTTLLRIAFKAHSVAHCAKPFYLYTLNFSSITTQFSVKHPGGILFGLRDWIRNAKSRGILDELSEAISRGAEKLVNVCVIERCFFSLNLSDADKAGVLRRFRDEYLALGLHPIEPTAPAVRFLKESDPGIFEHDPAILIDKLATIFPYAAPSQLKPDQVLKFGMGPSETAQRLKDKIVIIGQVDYQVRNAAAFARELTLLGQTCVVLDNSRFVAGGKRPFPLEEEHIFYNTEHVRVEKGPYPVDWLSTAKLVVVFNDFNDDFRDALEFRNRLELPSVCAIEGINDFLRADFEGYSPLPYRRCNHVFLAGEHDRRYFADRKTHVIGLPIVEELSQKQARFPSRPVAVLNVNFTYGVLEDRREAFIHKAKAAFEAVGVEWQITRHPMDKGNYDGLPVSDKTQYQLIDECTVFVSRFATGILEALASGKPAIYFNPHREKVDKFNEPLGAFEVATTPEELAQAVRNALDDVRSGVDFRARAGAFLKFHTGYNPTGLTSGARFASAAIEVISAHQDAQVAMCDLFFGLAAKQKLYTSADDQHSVILGDFEPWSKARLDEVELVARCLGGHAKRLAKVPTEPGESHEAESSMSVGLQAYTVVPALCTDTGSAAHEKIGEAKSKSRFSPLGLERADVLKVDIQNVGRLLSDDALWDLAKPKAVLAEFADAESAAFGHTTHALANALVERGYSIYLSEWSYDLAEAKVSDWRRLLRYTPDLDLGDNGGILIAIDPKIGDDLLVPLVKQTLKFAAKPELLGMTGGSGPEEWSYKAIETLTLELDRLWVLALIQERKVNRSLFSREKAPAIGLETPLAELVRIARELGVAIRTPQSFDEEAYLSAYPDVAKAIKGGEFASGYEHYVFHGHAEDGRERANSA